MAARACWGPRTRSVSLRWRSPSAPAASCSTAAWSGRFGRGKTSGIARDRCDQQVNIALRDPILAEGGLEVGESPGNPLGDRQDANTRKFLLDGANVVSAALRALSPVQQLPEDEHAGNDLPGGRCLVEAGADAPPAVERGDEDVRVEQPDHGISGGSALPPALRASRRISKISSSVSPCQGPAAAIQSPSPATKGGDGGTTRNSTSILSTRARTAFAGSRFSSAGASPRLVGICFSGRDTGLLLAYRGGMDAGAGAPA